MERAVLRVVKLDIQTIIMETGKSILALMAI
jgi:hypothetical protein